MVGGKFVVVFVLRIFEEREEREREGGRERERREKRNARFGTNGRE